jgi:hypothetical protein
MTAYRDGWARGGGAAPGTRRPLGTGSGRAFGDEPAPAAGFGTEPGRGDAGRHFGEAAEGEDGAPGRHLGNAPGTGPGSDLHHDHDRDRGRDFGSEGDHA